VLEKIQKDSYQGKRGEKEAFIRRMGSGFHAETGCKKVYAGNVLKRQQKSLEYLSDNKHPER